MASETIDQSTMRLAFWPDCDMLYHCRHFRILHGHAISTPFREDTGRIHPILEVVLNPITIMITLLVP